ncbi:MAG: 1-phosphofructokinase family hexose kinase [Puia sp.]|nr:1-phosphofructokinase family hexose kinase [Puia sp.]
MSAIVTITLNPSIDKHVVVPELVPGHKLRCSQPLLQPGGGGINVARATKRLGGDATAIYLAAGSNGAKLTRMLEEEGIRTRVIVTEGDTRENLMVVEQSSGLQYRFIFPGPAVSPSVREDLASILETECEGSFVVVSGSLPPGLPASVFGQLASIARNKKCKLVIDTSGEALKKALETGVYLLKASVRELYSLAGIEGQETEEQEANAIPRMAALANQLIIDNHCHAVVVSMGAAGALLVTEKGTRRMETPSVKAVSTIGAGDSMLAGIVLKLSLGEDLEKAVEYGCACGAASTLNEGTTLCSPRDVEQLYAQMHDNRQPRRDQIPGTAYTIL